MAQGIRLGVMGGTFDPIHHGHLYIAEETRQALSLNKVLFIPSAAPPHKEGLEITPAIHRLEMTRLATQGNPFFEVSPVEVEMGGKSYSIRTVERLLDIYGPLTEIYFITGVDAFAEISTWYEVDRLLSLCHFVATSRPGFPFSQLLGNPYLPADAAPTLQEMDNGNPIASISLNTGKSLILLRTLLLEISATNLRNRLGQGKSAKYLLPAPVESYIINHLLYHVKVPINR